MLFVIGHADSAAAHSGKQSYVYVSLFADGVDGRVEYPIADIADVLDLEAPTDVAAQRAFVSDHTDAIIGYTSEHFGLSSATAPWAIEFDRPALLVAAGGYVVVPYRVSDEITTTPRTFVAEFDGIMHANDQRDALLLVENDWKSARFANEDLPIAGFSVGQTVQQVTLENTSSVESMAVARGVGTDAIRTGIDQLMFVVALILPIGLVAMGGSVFGAAPRVGDALRRLGRALLIYVAAHSAMLWLVGLGVIDLSPRTVATLLALSLLVVAVYAAWRFTEHEAAVVAVLGLIQGLGFGEAFTASSLDRNSSLLPLIAFNVGVEVGVAIIVALVFPVLLLLRRTFVAPIALFGGATVISLYAIVWLIERIGDVELSAERVANPFRVWPRNLWLMLVVAAVAGGIYWWTASRDRLRPLTPTESPESETIGDRLPVDVR